MTALASPRASVEAPRPSVPRRRAPAVLWALGVVVVAPAAVPIGYLVWSVVRPGGMDAGNIPAGRLVELLASTGLLVVAVTLTTTALGFTTAWLTSRTDLPGRRWWSTLVVLPLVFPSYVGALAMLGASGNLGLLTVMLEPLGMGPVPVFSGFWAAWAALSLWNFSFAHLLSVPALRRMDPALEEAASGLGASRLRVLFTVVLPQLRPALTSAALLVSLYVLSDFGAVSLLRYETFTRAIYTQLRGRLDVAPALFLSGMLVIAALVLVVVEQRSRGRNTLHAPRPPRPPVPTRLSRPARLGALAFLSVLVAAALVVPAATLAWWAVRGAALGNPLGTVAAETARSGLAAVMAAALAVAAALPLAILTVRHRSRPASWLESITWSTYSLPHLAVGLGFLVFAIRYVPVAYQRLPLLIIAYLAMFLPQALASAQAGLRQVGPSIEEASRGLGAGALATLRRVTVPLVGRSLLAGGALVFLTAMKELPATLLLRPTGFETLSVRIWSAASELFYTEASMAALVLLAVSAVPLYLLVARDLHA